MASFGYIRTCEDILEHDFERAATDRAHFKALVTHLAEIATPNAGAVKVLVVCARVVQDASSWAEGTLRINLSNEGTSTKFEVLSDNAGLVERLFPAFTFRVPLREFSAVVERTPKAIAPLTVISSTPKKLSLNGNCANVPEEESAEDEMEAILNSLPKDRFAHVNPAVTMPGDHSLLQALVQVSKREDLGVDIEAPPKPAKPPTAIADQLATRQFERDDVPSAALPDPLAVAPTKAAPKSPPRRDIAELDDDFPKSERLTMPGDPPSGLIKESRDTVATVPPPTTRMTKEQERQILDQPVSTTRGSSETEVAKKISLDDLD